METKSKTSQLSAEELQLIADALEAIIDEDIAYQTLREATSMTLSEALEAQKQRKIRMVQSMIENKIPDGYAAIINDLLAAANIGKARQMDGRYFQINEDGSLTERID